MVKKHASVIKKKRVRLRDMRVVKKKASVVKKKRVRLKDMIVWFTKKRVWLRKSECG